MSRRTKCNYCTFKDMKKRYGEERLIVKRVDRSGGIWPVGYVEVFLKERNGDEHFLAVFVKLTNQCVC